jgi:hypothetical protein
LVQTIYARNVYRWGVMRLGIAGGNSGYSKMENLCRDRNREEKWTIFCCESEWLNVRRLLEGIAHILSRLMHNL